MLMELADEIHLPYKRERGYVKGVNVKRLPTHGLLVVLTFELDHEEVRSA